MARRIRSAPARILGIDFSGATDAGRKIWVAEGRRQSNGALVLIDLRPAHELEGGEIAPALAIAALARHIVKEPDTVAGCDFPFSLPRRLITEPSWQAFIAALPARFAHADEFRDWAFMAAGRREIRRVTDKEAKTPFNSYNIRIHRQTWWGMIALLRPLVMSGAAIVRPYQAMPSLRMPILIEACPACSLKSIGFYPSYKGHEDAKRRARKAVLCKLIDLGFLEAPPRKIERVLLDNSGGDALDAVVAAIATARADLTLDANRDELLEGRIYRTLHGGSSDSGLTTSS